MLMVKVNGGSSRRPDSDQRLSIQKRLPFIMASALRLPQNLGDMNWEQLPCPKCGGRMFQGFVPDYTYGAVIVGNWHAGQPKKSFWQRTKTPVDEGIPIGAFRCQKCGYLEFYADPKFAAQ